MFLSNDKLDKTKFKFIKYNYPNNYKFINVKYEKLDLIFQTPRLHTIYGINKYNYIELSFINEINSNLVKSFKKQLDTLYNSVNNKFKNYNVKHFIKDDNTFRLKINKNSLIYDNNKTHIDNIYPNTYGNYIIHLNGLWIDDKNNIFFNWIVLQSKIYLPIHLEDYCFIDDNKLTINDYHRIKNSNMNKNNIEYRLNKDKISIKSIPPPPPPPPPPPIITTNNNLKDIIKNNKINKKIIINSDKYSPPTMEEIKNAILNLNKKSNIRNKDINGAVPFTNLNEKRKLLMD
tara:strand:+ start:5148 stop:6014 length:867 start_codon:yes stop_codon:yes gene_type:complete